MVLKQKDSAADYFLAGRNLGEWIIGAAIFASNIGSEHLVGLAGPGATSGVALARYELHAWCLLVLAWVFVPFYMRPMAFTMPEFLERRFSPASRYVLSIVSDSGHPSSSRPLQLPAAVQGYLAPPIFVVFFLGVFFKRMNAQGASHSKTVTEEDRARTRASWSWKEVAGSAVVPACILGAYLYFRG